MKINQTATVSSGLSGIISSIPQIFIGFTSTVWPCVSLWDPLTKWVAFLLVLAMPEVLHLLPYTHVPFLLPPAPPPPFSPSSFYMYSPSGCCRVAPGICSSFMLLWCSLTALAMFLQRGASAPSLCSNTSWTRVSLSILHDYSYFYGYCLYCCYVCLHMWKRIVRALFVLFVLSKVHFTFCPSGLL